MKNLKVNSKILYIIFFILQLSFFVNGQDIQVKEWNETTSTYEPTKVFPPNAVVEDFGPRRVVFLNYHLGIDYNSVQDDGDVDEDGKDLRCVCNNPNFIFNPVVQWRVDFNSDVGYGDTYDTLLYFGVRSYKVIVGQYNVIQEIMYRKWWGMEISVML